MKIRSILFAVGICSVFSMSTWAKEDHQIIAEAENNHITIAEAKKTVDETAVTLTGDIVRQTKKEHYELKDTTGSIIVEIDDDLATPAQLKPGTQIRVIGEVDSHRHRPTDIDVVKLEFIR
ncbi:NirD/YgiW/YdeI family stress tolerance protein [Acinetobacter stercoris]|uniref:Uncharacterized protein n=1 Tax=Acinetobacter stercoris TaxID=2126983 RepID=A0A2U3N2C9_9GAMM|nr:NirD/YgiW/YdeI family stress tolerance protein [Acinetobacter stercoris]SPL71847.1 hypothetical protein KPC_3025 [Acinetobacter stercoris]